ncbi:hypothetical protein KA012_02005 [Candidatus Woesebacteria bacterium]|nr:hypothetical protein [Candidatus Woesebacteria bacterium]
MNQELRHHLLNYIILIMGLATGTFLFLIVWPDIFWLRAIAVVLGSFYLGWGLRTHWEAGHISAKIFWEYAAVSLTGVTLLWLLSW